MVGNFGHKREGARSPDVTLDNLNGIILSHKLNVKWTGNLEFGGDLLGNLPGSADGFEIKLLGRKDYCGVAGMDAGVFDMLGNSVDENLAAGGYTINFEFFGVLDEFRNNHRVIWRQLGRPLQVALQYLVRADNVHRPAGQNVRRTDQNR